MICWECQSYLYPQAFSTGKCRICDCDIVTPHMPPYAICEKHSKEFNLCQQCGVKLDGEENHQEYQ